MSNSTMYLNQDSNNNIFINLTLEEQQRLLEFYELGKKDSKQKETQEALLEIGNSYRLYNLKEIANNEWKYDDDDILEQVLDRNWSSSESTQIIDSLKFGLSYEAEEVLENISSTELEKLMALSYSSNSKLTLYDIEKAALFEKLAEKYNYLELEEKLKQLI